MKILGVWAVGLLLLIAVAAGLGTGFVEPATVIYTGFLAVPIVLLAVKVPGGADRTWLPQLIISGYVLKLAASGLRYYVLVGPYHGSGDATGYYNRGLAYAGVWRSFHIPDIDALGAGTSVVSNVTAFLFAPYVPTKLGGFFLFATVAYLGQVLFYVAFRRAMPSSRHRLYATSVMLLPALLYWPSSIGKESVILFLLGLVAWGTAHLVGRYRLRWVVVASLGLGAVSAIRPHIGALFATAITVAVLLGRAPAVKAAKTRRLMLMAVAGVGVVVLVFFVSESFGVDLSGDDLDPFLADLQRNTQQGGSAVEGGSVRSVADVPPAILRTLYRPLINEVVNLQTRLAALEGTALLILSIWRIPAMIRDVRRWRRYPYLLFSVTAVIGFVLAFSPILNLGILARQRTQVLPLLLVLLVGTGRASAAPPRETAELQSVGAA